MISYDEIKVSRGITRMYLNGLLVGKVCSKCTNLKEMSLYYEDTSRPDARKSICIECTKNRANDYYDQNSDEVRSKRSQYRLENIESVSNYNREYSKNNRNVCNENKRSFRSRNRSRSLEELIVDRDRSRHSGLKICRCCKSNLPLVNFHTSTSNTDGLQSTCIDCYRINRRNRRYKVYENFWISASIPFECYMCSGAYQEVEHIVPISLGGLDIPENARPSCTKCNHGADGKHDLPMEVYIYLIEHPTKTRSEVLEGLMLDGAWPFSVEYGSKEWEELEISGDPEFSHLFDK